MNLQTLEQMINHLDRTLSTKNLYPEEYKRLSQARDWFVGELEFKRKREALSMLRRKARKGLEERTPGPFLGEEMSRSPECVYPKEYSRLSPEVIHPEDYQRPRYGAIRNVMPNRAQTRDRMIIEPKRLKKWRRRRQEGI